MDYARKRNLNTRPHAPRRKSGKAKIILVAILATGVLFFALRYGWREMRFRYIVIHHTASDYGNLEYYRKMHMEERGWPDVAYHFIINNGTSNTAMGQIEESSLWKNRSIHYSTKRTLINYLGIAVVLVGNFENHSVPSMQYESLVNLVVRLSREYGIPPERIYGHREIWSTACPGKNLNMQNLRADVARALTEN